MQYKIKEWRIGCVIPRLGPIWQWGGGVHATRLSPLSWILIVHWLRDQQILNLRELLRNVPPQSPGVRMYHFTLAPMIRRSGWHAAHRVQSDGVTGEWEWGDADAEWGGAAAWRGGDGATPPASQVPTPKAIIGAGYQCGSSRFCPQNVLCQDYVLHMSSLCPYLVLVQFMTSICHQNPSFVLIKSSFCPCDPPFGLFLSGCWVKIDRKSKGQNLVKTWTW